jgi:hypothetical protein
MTGERSGAGLRRELPAAPPERPMMRQIVALLAASLVFWPMAGRARRTADAGRVGERQDRDVRGPEPSRDNAMKAVRFDQYGGVEREVERRRPGDVSIANPFVRFW